MSSPFNPGPGNPPPRRPGDPGPGHVPPRRPGDPGPGHVPPRHLGDPGPGTPPPPQPDPRKLRGGDSTGRDAKIDPFANVKHKIMDEYTRKVREGDAAGDRILRSIGRDPASEGMMELKQAINKLVLQQIVKEHSQEIEEIRSKIPRTL